MAHHSNFGRLRQSVQRGVALLEALIAIVLFSIAILGMVALQAKATQFSVQSQDRTTAALLANDMVSLLMASGSVSPSSAVSSAWSSRISVALPSGQGFITTDSCGNTEISVAWQAVGKSAASVATSSAAASSAASAGSASSAAASSVYTNCVTGFSVASGLNSAFTTKFILMPRSSSSASSS